MKPPLISVVMAVYNCESFVSEAIDSILTQSFKDFEFIIINDGSNDNTDVLISKFTDKRIKYFRLNKNMGLVHCLNLGIRKCQGKYIARMDADDISLPNRFATQVEFLESNPNVGVCGSFVQVFGSIDSVWNPPITSERIKAGLINGSTISHPASMLRVNVLLKNSITYKVEYNKAEDYFLWFQLSSLTDFYNIPQVLLRYRITEQQVSNLHSSKQIELSQKIRQLFILQIPNLKQNEVFGLIASKLSIRKSQKIIYHIIKNNNEFKIFNRKYLVKELALIYLNRLLINGNKIDKIKFLVSPLGCSVPIRMKLGLLKRVLF